MCEFIICRYCGGCLHLTTTRANGGIFRRAYPAEEDEASGSEAPQQSRSGKQPSHIEGSHNLDDPFAIGDNADASGGEDMGEPAHGSTEEQTERRADGGDGRYGSFAEERNAWGGSGAE